MTALATNEITIEFPGGYKVKIVPKRLADGKVMMNLDLNTPYGKVDMVFFMLYETYSKIMADVVKSKAHLKIADFFAMHFGGRPAIKRY